MLVEGSNSIRLEKSVCVLVVVEYPWLPEDGIMFERGSASVEWKQEDSTVNRTTLFYCCYSLYT